MIYIDAILLKEIYIEVTKGAYIPLLESTPIKVDPRTQEAKIYDYVVQLKPLDYSIVN